MAGVVIAALAVVTVMDQFGVDVLGVVTALGVVGIAVGFAAQDTLSNFISGVTLLVERPFQIGDWVELAGKVGRVERITCAPPGWCRATTSTARSRTPRWHRRRS